MTRSRNQTAKLDIKEEDMGYLFTKPFYHTCPYCGANLDPEESCDCKNEKIPPARTRKDKRKIPLIILTQKEKKVNE